MDCVVHATMRTSILLGCNLVFFGGIAFGVETEKSMIAPVGFPEIQAENRGRMTVKLEDNSAGFWTLQSSEDMQRWKSVSTLQARGGALSYLDPAKNKSRTYFYRLVNSNTLGNVLIEEEPFTFQSSVPSSFIQRESVVFRTPASAGGGGWAGSNGTINESFTVTTEVLAPEAPIRPDSVRDHKAFLGRVLFYDKRLSADNSKSCASCHKQEKAFADDKPLSDGIHGQKTARNSMPLANMAFAADGKFFWDMRESTLRDTVLRPIENPLEMGMDLEQLPEKLSQQPYYAELFETAFGSPEITEETISEGLSTFLNSMVSGTTKFDRAQFIGRRHFSALERLGETLFMGKAGCAQCHSAPFFDNTIATNNGLDIYSEDEGMASHTKKESDRGFFKTPTLRNVALTAPYMHDGRFKTLDDVVDHYNKKIQPHDELDETLRLSDSVTTPWESTKVEQRQTVQLDLSEQERDALVAFMETLTDHKLIQDKRFSDPFKR